jgi:small subunit ribosomal protein S4
MARYTGPVSKKARRFGEPIFGPDKAMKKKPFPPGQHGRGRRRKQSEYALQLMEKQKAKYTYGVLERQFRNTFERASNSNGITGTILLQLLESRLDNVVYRLGLSSTRRGARQMVSHKHIEVNGVVTNIASFKVQPGDIISVREKSRSKKVVTESMAATAPSQYGWFEWDSKKLQGKMLHLPEREDIPENIKEQLIVELYSK